MDAAGLTILARELAADAAVARGAAENAATWLHNRGPGHLQACAYELNRFYNTIERVFERICDEFENHFERRGDYHEKLLHRLSLDIPGIRPAFIPADQTARLRELKGFRHVMRHAYDLALREDRLTELAASARAVAEAVPVWCADFELRVRAEQDW